MTKFKVGDRVEYFKSPKTVGAIIEVFSINTHDSRGQEYRIKWDKYNHPQRSYYDQHLILLETVKTDQELADETREARKVYYSGLMELQKRGYSVPCVTTVTQASIDREVVIKKVVTTEVVL